MEGVLCIVQQTTCLSPLEWECVTYLTTTDYNHNTKGIHNVDFIRALTMQNSIIKFKTINYLLFMIFC